MTRPKIMKTKLVVGSLIGVLILCLSVVYVVRQWMSNFTLSTCSWSGIIRSWEDEDENGIWDIDEDPITDISYIVHLEGTEEVELSRGENGEQGFVFHRTCDPEDTSVVTIYPLMPPNMRTTTKSEIVTSIDQFGDEPRVFEFGFVVDSGD